MTKIQLTPDNVMQLDNRNAFEVNGEAYAYHTKLPADYDEQGYTVTHVWKREGDGAFFSTDLYYVRYGYENYELEADLCELEMTEVALVPVTTTQWESIIGRGCNAIYGSYVETASGKHPVISEREAVK